MTRAASDRTVSATVTAHLARGPLLALAERGHDWALEARRCGLPVTFDPDFRWRVPVDAMVRLFARGRALVGPGFPVLAATRPAHDHTSPFGFYNRTRRDGREAFRALTEHWDLVSDGWWISLDEADGDAILRWHARPGVEGVDDLWWFDVADIAVSARSIMPGLPEFTVETSLAPPPGLDALGVRVAEGRGHALILPAPTLDARLPPCDPALRAHTERLLRQLLAERPQGSSIRSAIRALGPTTTLDAVAARLELSTRTLHRRLAAAGTSFRRELDAVRAERARDLVGTVPADVAAEALGYSDARALRRAVRRWRTADPEV
jgi:AraC-like DNA-binding protein